MAWRRDVGRYVDLFGEIKKEHLTVWLKARQANTVNAAYWSLKHALPDAHIPRPAVRLKAHQEKFLSTTGQYTLGYSDPRDLSHN
jgi:hypothetical protein